jgi:hypothetical protein
MSDERTDMTDTDLAKAAAEAVGAYHWVDGDCVMTHGDGPGAVSKFDLRAALAALLADRASLDIERDALRIIAQRYRWLRDRNDWYAEPRLDEEDGTKWELVFFSPQRIEDPTDDNSLDAAVDAAIAADPEFGAA